VVTLKEKTPMKKVLFIVSMFCLTAFADGAREILPSDTSDAPRITNRVFEGYGEDYVIKNRGVLILEDCTFKNNTLGSKDSEVIFSNDRIVAPIVNYGKLYLLNCKFEGNYSWNTALTDDMKAQTAAGAIVNFGELNMSNVSFENNLYQKGYFTIIRDENIEQFSYIGNDAVYNHGNIHIEDIATPQKSGFQLEVALVENPVMITDKADIVVKTSAPARIEIVISSVASNVVFSASDENVNGTQKYVWNLKNKSGVRVSSGSYALKVVATNGSGVVSKTLLIGVKE
jgi:hypothetical protein